MPKKFAGENSKAVAARQRKENVKQEKDQKIKKMMEDAEWDDNDDKLKKKQQKKVRVLEHLALLEPASAHHSYFYSQFYNQSTTGSCNLAWLQLPKFALFTFNFIKTHW